MSVQEHVHGYKHEVPSVACFKYDDDDDNDDDDEEEEVDVDVDDDDDSPYCSSDDEESESESLPILKPMPKRQLKPSVSLPTAVDLEYGCNTDLGYEDVMPSSASLGYDSTCTGSITDQFESSLDLATSKDLGYGDETDSCTASCPLCSKLTVEIPHHLGDSAPALPSRRRSRTSIPQSDASTFDDSLSCEPERQDGEPPEVDKEVVVVVAPSAPEPPGPVPRPRLLRRQCRRASVTGAAPTHIPRRRMVQQRRITMDHVQPTQLSQPAHHTKVPRRSSMKSTYSIEEDVATATTAGSSGASTTAMASFSDIDQSMTMTFRERAQRRVSFGSSAAVSHVAPLHQTEEDKKELYYNSEELGKLRRKVKKMAKHVLDKPIDETQESLRGLESYVKRYKEGKNSRNVSEHELCNQIMLQLQQKLRKQAASAAAGAAAAARNRSKSPSLCSSISSQSNCSGSGSEDDDDDDDNSNSSYYSDSDEEDDLVMDLQLSAKRMLRRASRTGVKMADRDAAEARAIYMESLPQEQVRIYFGEIEDSSARRKRRSGRPLRPGSYRASVA